MPHALRRRALQLCALAALTAALPAGAASIPPGTPLAAKQEMVRNNGDEPESLDPALVESDIAINIDIDLFEGLTALDNHSKVVPGVAQSWQQVAPTTWVFKLRKDARWSNGEPVTAQDFVYGWHRLVDPKNAAPLGSSLAAFILNGTAIVQGKLPVAALGVRAIDAATLEVKTPGVIPFLPMLLTQTPFSPAPRATIEKYGSEWIKPGHLVSDGAYVLAGWEVNNKVVVAKSPTYWDAANVALTRVTYLAVQDDNADLKLYQSGEDDMTSRLPPGTYESLKAQLPKDMHNGLLIAQRFHVLNVTDPLLKDVRVRKALSMVIDREVLAAKVTADGQLPLYSLMVRGNEGVDAVRYDWADWPMERRVAEARKLLAAAGVKPGTRLKYIYNTNDYNKRMAIFAAVEWKTKLGLETDLESVEYKVLIARRQGGQYQLSRSAWTPQYADATGFLALVQCGDIANDSKSCVPAADDLIHQAGATTDAAKRKALLTQATRLEMDDYATIPLLQMSAPRLVKPWIGGYDDANDQNVYRSKDFYVIRH